MNIIDISSARTFFISPTTRETNPAPTSRSSTNPAVSGNAEELSSTEKAFGKVFSEEPLDISTKKVQEFVNYVASDIEFSIDEDSGQTVVKVIDRATKEVLRQIPSEEMLELAKALDKLQGLLLRQEV